MVNEGKKPPTKADLSESSLEDLVQLIELNEKRRIKIEKAIDKLVREAISLLLLAKQRKLNELTEERFLL